jgi:hypothetical protein
VNKVLNFGGERIVVAQVPESEVWIPRLLKEMDTNRTNIGRSHKIRGRWENSYLEEGLVPTIRVPMRFARNLGKEELGVSSVILFKPLPFSSDQFPPFWFNLAQGGEETGLHDHVDQAILSCVVYLDCKKDSGNLFFRIKEEDDLEVLPEVGKMILFSPSLRHGVRENRSESERISLAFNLFPFPLPAVDL